MTNPEPLDESQPRTVYSDLPSAAVPRRRRFLIFGTVLAALLAAGGTMVWVDTATGPEVVVEDFFDAIVDKDVERALNHVGREGYGVPSGEAAVFMDPDAIADGWKLLEVDANAGKGEYGEDLVDITIGDGETSVEGQIEVTETDDAWKIVDPFVVVEFSATSLTYFKVNDLVVDAKKLYGHDITGMFTKKYKLLPGMTRFFGDLKGVSGTAEPGELVLPKVDDYLDPVPVSPPRLEFDDEVQEAVQKDVNKIVDDCAEFKVRRPSLCPFGIDSTYWADEDHHYDDLHDVTWTVEKYPRVRVTDPGKGEERQLGLPITVDDPGVITVDATAATIDDDSVTLTAECGVSGSPLRAAMRPDGEPEVAAVPFQGLGLIQLPYELDTCDNKLYEELG